MAGLFLLSALPRTPELLRGRGGYKDGTLVVVQLPSGVGLCDPVDRSTPGLLVLHRLLGFAQVRVH